MAGSQTISEGKLEYLSQYFLVRNPTTMNIQGRTEVERVTIQGEAQDGCGNGESQALRLACR